MIKDKKIIVVMPSYNSEATLEQTVNEIDRSVVDDIIVVDDASTDGTKTVAKELDLNIFVHETNLGYGANQKSCYRLALDRGADIVVMVHPDYQYDPRLVNAMAYMIHSDIYQVVLGSRILGKGALEGGMPLYKYIANRCLTLVQNLIIREKLTEYHTGYRAFSAKVLRTLPLGENSNDFVFDNQMLCQVSAFGFKIGEVSCPTKYFDEASSINFRRSVTYGCGVLVTSLTLALHRMGWKNPLFDPEGKKLDDVPAVSSTSE